MSVVEDTDSQILFLSAKLFDLTLEIDKENGFEKIDELPHYTQAAAHVFLNCVNYMFGNTDDPRFVKIFKEYNLSFDTNIGAPVGAGLGSSGSFNSVFSGSIYTTLKLLSNWDSGLPKEINYSEKDIDSVKKLTDFGEGLVHGNPSGIDSYIINHGGIVKFQKLEDGSLKIKTDLSLPKNLNFDIIFTGVSRSTKTSLDEMIAFKESKPGMFLQILT